MGIGIPDHQKVPPLRVGILDGDQAVVAIQKNRVLDVYKRQVHDGVPGLGHALVLQQQAQKFKFLVGQGNLLPCHPDHMAPVSYTHLGWLHFISLFLQAQDHAQP